MGPKKRPADRPVRTTPSKYSKTPASTTSATSSQNSSEALNVLSSNEKPLTQINNQAVCIDYTRLAKEILNQQQLSNSEQPSTNIPDTVTSTSIQQQSTSTTANVNVTDNISSLINNILGSEPSARVNNVNTSVHQPVTDFTAGMSIDAHVSQKLRDKIWCDDFIDLGSLLPKNIENETWAVTVTPGQVSVQNRLNTFKPKQALSFLDWNEAFHIFMAIFLRKYPTEASNLLKYMSIIREIYELRGNEAFHFYDESFHVLRKEHKQPWQIVVDDIYKKTMYMKSSKFTQKSGNTGNTTMNNKNQPFLGSSRHGTCHVYNKYGSCVRKNCNYAHVCRICRGPHPVTKCTKAGLPDHKDKGRPSQIPPKPSKS